MKKIKIIAPMLAVAILQLLLPASPARSGEKTKISDPPLILNYDALYAGYRIGEIDITKSGIFDYEGKKARELECRIESSGIIDHHGIYRSVVGADYRALYLKSDVTTGSKRDIFEYWFDYKRGRIRLKFDSPDRDKPSEYSMDMTEKDRRYFDTVSLVFRMLDGLDTLKAPFYVPVYVDSRPDSVLIESLAAEPFTMPDGDTVAVKHARGVVPFDTFPGFGNRFDLYISDDGEHVPLKASLQMVIGKIEIVPRE